MDCPEVINQHVKEPHCKSCLLACKVVDLDRSPLKQRVKESLTAHVNRSDSLDHYRAGKARTVESRNPDGKRHLHSTIGATKGRHREPAGGCLVFQRA